ncbi:SymE family type I addiction module toxin [Halochromatium glycolicum]|uniref:Toxin SymE-like domain-containing protein n=1 Tax=Halochromatium glycolicum TaxID=85075 RepID=A0AAJ0U8L6_9GAMM|nr:hypothetical protein [Halochromatium glycolicum]
MCCPEDGVHRCPSSSHWLEQAGFAIGTQYTIEVYNGKLVFIASESGYPTLMQGLRLTPKLLY